MTGNAVLLSLLLTGNGPAGAGNLAATCTSLAAFIAAGAVFGQVGHWVGDRARRWLLASLVVQTALVALAAALVDTPHGTRSALISLLSAAGGAQVALAKGTGNPQISTVGPFALHSWSSVSADAQSAFLPFLRALPRQAILTSPFIDTVGNRDLLRPFSLPSARRRLLIVQWVYLATFFAGAFLGGVGLRHAGTRAVFWASVGLRAAVTLWVGLLPVEDEETKPASD